MKYGVPKNISVAFHNGSNYDYDFIIKQLPEKLKKTKQFTCLGENTEKYIIFSVLIEKEVTRIDKNGEEITKKYISNILIYWQREDITIYEYWYGKLISTFVNNFSEGIDKNKCKYRHDDK